MSGNLTADGARIPRWLKLVYTTFMLVLIPSYLPVYGWANFLWFCDIALLVTWVGLWRESRLLISTQALAIVTPQILWIVSFVVSLTTDRSFLGLADYMFDAEIPLYVRSLSLFHGWLPVLLVWLVCRVGYERKALRVQTLIGWTVLVITYLTVPGPATAAGNVNKVFGFDDAAPQTMMPGALWVAMLCVGYAALVYLPTHFVLNRWCGGPAASE